MKKHLKGLIKEYILYEPFNYALFLIEVILIIFLIIVYYYYDNSNVLTISGIIITPILTIALVMIWEGYNSKRRKKALLQVLVDEINTNVAFLITDYEIIQSDLKLIKNESTDLRPLLELSIENWNLLKNHFPQQLINLDILVQISYYQGIKHLNKMVGQREYFQMNEKWDYLANYDKYIMERIKNLLESIGNLLESEEIAIILEDDKFREKLKKAYIIKNDDENFNEFLIKLLDPKFREEHQNYKN